MYAVSQVNQPSFACVCDDGFGGDFCEGPLTKVQLTISPQGGAGSGSGSGSYDTGSVSLPPGSWSFYNVFINTSTLRVNQSDALDLSWSIKDPSFSNLFFIFSPVYTNSLGGLYFMPAASWVLNHTAKLQVSWITGTHADMDLIYGRLDYHPH